MFSVQVRGKKTQDENIADNAALKQAFFVRFIIHLFEY
jgi:hypothetical protein